MPQPPESSPTDSAPAVSVEEAGNGLAIAALVLGIVGTVFGLIPLTFFIAIVLGLVGLGLGIPAVISAQRRKRGRKVMAWIGTTLSAAAVVLGFVGAAILNDVFEEAEADLQEIEQILGPGTGGDRDPSQATDGPPRQDPPPVLDSEFLTFGDGDYRVPDDLGPGTYRTRKGSARCYWEVVQDFSGQFGSIIANENDPGPAVVTIAPSAGGFSTQGCAEWTDDLSQITGSKTAFKDGTFIVGTDIAPGSYRSEGAPGCYWERLRSFEGGINGLISNDNVRGSVVVEIAASDRGFRSENCGTWSRADQQRESASSGASAAAPAQAERGSTACADGLTVGPNTSCPFAEAVRASWFDAGGGNAVLDVYSPVTQRNHTMTCVAGAPTVCRGGNNASVFIG